MATSTIKSSNWKYLGMVEGNNAVTLPSGWEEVHLEAGEGDSGSSDIRYVYPVNALRLGLFPNGTYYYIGDYRAKSQKIFLVTATQARCMYSFTDGVDDIASNKCKVWYR